MVFCNLPIAIILTCLNSSIHDHIATENIREPFFALFYKDFLGRVSLAGIYLVIGFGMQKEKTPVLRSTP